MIVCCVSIVFFFLALSFSYILGVVWYYVSPYVLLGATFFMIVVRCIRVLSASLVSLMWCVHLGGMWMWFTGCGSLVDSIGFVGVVFGVI